MSTHPAAEKTARTISDDRAFVWIGLVCTKSLIDEIARAAINEATKEQQERIDSLVEALREAHCCLVMEGYGSSHGRSHHTVMDQVRDALEPFKDHPHKEMRK